MSGATDPQTPRLSMAARLVIVVLAVAGAANLMLVAKGYAAGDGRDFLIPDDVKHAAIPVLRHRLVLRPEAELEGFDTDKVVGDILTATALPK